MTLLRCYFLKIHFNMEFVPLTRQKCEPLFFHNSKTNVSLLQINIAMFFLIQTRPETVSGFLQLSHKLTWSSIFDLYLVQSQLSFPMS